MLWTIVSRFSNAITNAMTIRLVIALGYGQPDALQPIKARRSTR